MPVKLNPWVILGVLLALLVVLGGTYYKGYRAGQDDRQSDWNKAENARALSVETNRQGQQGKSDNIDENTNKIIQGLLNQNAAIQRELDDEKAKPDYDCVLPVGGVQQYRKNVSTTKG